MHRQSDQFDVGGEISVAHRLRFGVVGGQIFFVIIGKGGDHHAVIPQLILFHHTAKEIRPRGNPHADAQLLG